MDVGAVGAEKSRSHSVQKNLKPMLCEKLDKKDIKTQIIHLHMLNRPTYIT